MTDTKTAGGLITIVDDKPAKGFGRIVQDAMEMVSDETWRKLLAGKPLEVLLVDKIANPAWAEGLWRSTPRRAVIRRQYRGDGQPKRGRVQYIALHEIAGHGSDSSSLGSKKRNAVMALMDPKPGHWRDRGSASSGSMAGYWALPSESYANRLVEALTLGEVRSPFDDDYTRTIADKHLDELLRIVAGADEPSPTPDPEPEPPLNPELAELGRMLEEARAEIAHYEDVTYGAVALLWDDAWGARPAKPPET
jgi:hypothetical protein